MDNSQTRVNTMLQLSMFERVVIAVVAAAMGWIGITVTKNAVTIARLEERTKLVAAEVAVIKNKIDANILPVADVRLNAAENRLRQLENTVSQIRSKLEEHDRDPDHRREGP